MTYQRVIPRDLFNEASLLKCLGKVYINLETANSDAKLVHDGNPFHIEQDASSGALFCSNVNLFLNDFHIPLTRPLNSRAPWPLYAVMPDGEECAVFEDDGTFTAEFLTLIASNS